MRRFRRSTLVLVPAVLSAFTFAGVGTSNAALLSRQLKCSDGTNLSLTLSLTQLTQLTNAIAAMTLYPAGLSCSLSLLGLRSTQSSSAARTPDLSLSSSQHDYAVGGGRGPAVLASRCPSTVFPNFGLSAHVASGTTTQGVGGTFDVKVPANAPCEAQLVSRVDCLGTRIERSQHPRHDRRQHCCRAVRLPSQPGRGHRARSHSSEHCVTSSTSRC